MVAPPSPVHLLRSHSSPLSTLYFSDDNERLYSGDASGLVVVTSTRSLRAISRWTPHTDSLLGVQEWGKRVITHGRDNKLHVWTRVEELPSSVRLGGSAGLPGLPIPTLCYSMDVNALNYCRFSLMPLLDNASGSKSYPDGGGTSLDESTRALIALPNLVDSSSADVWSLPCCQRIHAAIGKESKGSIFSTDGRGSNATGIIMSMHLYVVYAGSSQQCSPSQKAEDLRLLCAYENGSVALRRYASMDNATSVEGIGWEVIWSVKLHVESIMAMTVSRDDSFALTVSADHLVGRYELSGTRPQDPSSQLTCIAHRTKHPGNGCIAIHDDGKVCAIGGWDGKIRLYSTRRLKPLGTLTYHKTSCQAVAFARSIRPPVISMKSDGHGADEDEDDDLTSEEKAERTRWLVGGSKDNRVTIWSLMNFEKT